MRLQHPSGRTVHLGYCTNVHAAHDVDGIVTQLATYARPVRERLGTSSLSVGTWLSADAVHTLRHDAGALARLRDGLREAGGEVVTVNAFPYGAFQAPVVKHAVYHPDWTTTERLTYTADAAWVLARLLPDDVARGSISTLPLAWREPWDAAGSAVARDNLARLTDELAAIERETGRSIQVGLEPEPGCVVETVEQAVVALDGLDTSRLGVCLDLCHLATGFGTASDAVDRLAAAGVPIVKAQVSAALHVEDPADDESRAALAEFAEDRFLHQVRVPAGSGVSDPAEDGWDDLPDALGSASGATAAATGAATDPWRVHFHVPLHAEAQAPGLRSTTAELRDSLDVLLGGPAPLVDHLEVESYTWGVLPAAQRPTTDAALVAGIAAELAWASDHLATLGLTPELA
ncbi:xylose isomerase [Serinibacter arcticus]|uniref:Xylose isomerase n=1 Tax=Serinibacter arcticus TaxID=1655435 RepID=A0A2U1ZVR9_9MICO|nr:metabolite traffic protein EboE [Serinibacter arcticus]PWD51078.1 xylose isomerase [Serinibacter arcticus]